MPFGVAHTYITFKREKFPFPRPQTIEYLTVDGRGSSLQFRMIKILHRRESNRLHNISCVLLLLQYLVVSSRKIFFYNSDADHKSSSTPSIILEIRWVQCLVKCYIEDITCPLVDTNFIFSCSTRYRVEHEKIKFVSTSGHVIFCLLYRHRWNTRKTISWTYPLFAESCIIKYRSYAHSYFSREIEKISSVYLYSERYSNKAYKILLKRCVIVL